MDRYEEALERAKEWEREHPNGYVIRDMMEHIFPGYNDSEDERIRKRLVDCLKVSLKGAEEQDAAGCSRQKDIEAYKWGIAYLERQKEQKPIIQDVELNDAVYDYVRDHFIAGADFTPEYIKKLMENAFFAGVDYYLLKQESESCEPDTNVEKVIEDVILVYEKTQGGWVGGYDVDTLIVNLRRAFNKKEQKPAEWSEEDGLARDFLLKQTEQSIKVLESVKTETYIGSKGLGYVASDIRDWKNARQFILSLHPHWKPSEYTLSLVKKVANGEMLAGEEQMAMGTLEEQLKKL